MPICQGPKLERRGAPRAADWATLIDPWSLPIYRDVLDRLNPQPGERALDATRARITEKVLSAAREHETDGNLRLGGMARCVIGTKT